MGGSDHPFPADQGGKAEDTLGDELRMLHPVVRGRCLRGW